MTDKHIGCWKIRKKKKGKSDGRRRIIDRILHQGASASILDDDMTWLSGFSKAIAFRGGIWTGYFFTSKERKGKERKGKAM
jgi:hypothetical protein